MTETDDSTSKAPPALFEHCVNTYQAMLREARAIVSIDPNLADEGLEGAGAFLDEKKTEGSSIIVYEGFFTQLVTGKLNLSVPYYTSITKALTQMGCIRQLKRGGGTSPSQWELIFEPTIEAFTNSQPKKSKKPSKDAMFQEQMDNLNRRVFDLETQLDAILESLVQQFGTTKVED